MRQRKRPEVTVSFQVTFKLPRGMTIPTARMCVKNALVAQKQLELTSDAVIKCHLTNKEVKYG